MNEYQKCELKSKQQFLQIKKWLLKNYADYNPKVEAIDTFSITYVEDDCVYKLSIKICDHTQVIRYYIEMPYKIEEEHYGELLDKINKHHLKSVIGRFDLNLEQGVLIFNYWNSYNPNNLDLSLIDRGMGIAMICCNVNFGMR